MRVIKITFSQNCMRDRGREEDGQKKIGIITTQNVQIIGGGKENWKGADAPGLSRFVSHVDKLADMIGNNKDRFVRAFGLVFGGIPSDRNWASAAYSVKQGPHDLQTLFEGPQGFNPDLLDDSIPSHHYAGLFYLGYHAGNHVGRAVNFIRDRNSMPDILLGNIAADHGRLFYTINTGDLAEWIYEALSVNNAQ